MTPLEANLADIIGREKIFRHDNRVMNHDDWRVCELGVSDDGKVWIAEACDDYFGIELSSDEVRRLIAWLEQALQQDTPSA
jgi:hypothetical protein